MNTPMNADEIVNLLRVRAETQNKRGYSGEASELIEIADLIESLTAENARLTTERDEAALNLQQENAECRRLQEQFADEKDAHESTKLLRDSMYAEKDAQLAASQRRERDGRVVVLPCKLGTELWFVVTKNKGKKSEYSFVKMGWFCESNFFSVLKRFGKTVFLTREAAEAALKGASND